MFPETDDEGVVEVDAVGWVEVAQGQVGGEIGLGGEGEGLPIPGKL